MKKFFAGLGADILGSVLLGAGIYCFSEKIGIAPGGASGLAAALAARESLDRMVNS